MGGNEFENRTGIGSVKSAISRYGGKVNIDTGLRNEFQEDAPHSEERSSKARDLHIAKNTVDRINEHRRTAETVTSQAMLELLNAKKKVRELTSQIQQSKFKAKQKTEEHQKLPSQTENHQYMRVVRELESLKREVSKIKLDMACAVEEKYRAEKEENAAGLKLESYVGIAENLRREIEEANEEEVLVELARIQACKEFAAIEAQRKEDGEKFSSKIQEARKKINVLRKEVEQAKRLEEVLAITNAEADVLQSELKFIKEMDRRIERSNNVQLKNLEFQSVTKDLEAAKKEHAAIRAGVFELMTSMDLTRIELNSVLKEKDQMQKAEAKTEKYIKKLNSKLLRSKDKLEAAKASEEKAKLMLPSFIISLQELEKIKETAQNEKASIIEETISIRDDIQKIESTTDSTEERLQAAMQELEAVKTAEASALKNLKTLVENVVVARASKDTTNITISNFEYDYLTGRAKGAEDIAEKKMAAALAWADALNANAKEMQIKTAFMKEETKELRLKEEQELSKMVILSDNRDTDELEKPGEKENNSVYGRKPVIENSYNWTPARQTKFRKSIGSPAGRRPIIATSLTQKRKKKVVGKITNYFVNKQTENEKTVSVEVIH
ncbi:hypothetical protein RND81_03G178600 [Saponaria officinalis]|uniref:Protein PLASTID MOVEMENT IMPAIRED 2 n=1 Tax=Saponaria officinalis TaxID=3572 RepID=A0AAW1M4W1_SAPOF